MHEPVITVVGNLAWPPRRRTLATGTVVADFRVASTPRRPDRASGTWVDGETLWFSVTCWRALADHVAETLRKGDRVVVTGRLTTRSWTNEQGERRSGLEIEASAVGLDLARGSVIRPAAEAGVPITAGQGWPEPTGVDPFTGELAVAVAEPGQEGPPSRDPVATSAA